MVDKSPKDYNNLINLKLSEWYKNTYIYKIYQNTK